MNAALVDTGPLVALLSADDRFHEACRGFLSSFKGRLLTAWPNLTEASHLLGTRWAPAQESLLGLVQSGALEVAEISPDDVGRMRTLLKKYADLPMDLADAALVAVAERERIAEIVTLDRRDFSIYRPSHVGRFRLLP